MDSHVSPDPELEQPASVDTDTDTDTDTEIVIKEGSWAHATELISTSVSVAPSDGSKAGLPDFTAIIMAEIAAAEAADETSRTRGSPLGAGEVIGLRSPGSATPKVLGAMALSDDDGLADYFPMTAPSLFEGPPGR